MGRARCETEVRHHHGGEIEGDAVHVSGYLFARDFTEMMSEMHAHGDEALGMSYELADAHVENMRAEVWRLTKATFTGAAILLRSKAAYQKTSFRLMRAESLWHARVAASCSSRTRCEATCIERAPAMRPMPQACRKGKCHASSVSR